MLTLALLTALATPGAPAPFPKSMPAEKRVFAQLQKAQVFSGGNLTLRVRAVRGGKLVVPSIELRDRAGRIMLVGQAQEGELRPGKGGGVLLRLRHGGFHTNDGSRVTFDDRLFDLPVAP